MMSHSAEDSQIAIARTVADAHEYARDRRPCFGLTVLLQALAIAKAEQQSGYSWAAAAVATVEAEIRSYREAYHL